LNSSLKPVDLSLYCRLAACLALREFAIHAPTTFHSKTSQSQHTLGFEVIYRAHGKGYKASRKEARQRLRRYRNSFTSSANGDLNNGTPPTGAASVHDATVTKRRISLKIRSYGDRSVCKAMVERRRSERELGGL
jgi:hypothetical protein